MTLFSKHKVLLYILKPIKLIDKLDIYIHEFILKNVDILTYIHIVQNWTH